ncbi:MAG TPA: hypothetical protein VGO53_16315 [Steroidobacteraceae bacterium]|nr:hypothetical protein [Steroidobacteraceae bacterium]
MTAPPVWLARPDVGMAHAFRLNKLAARPDIVMIRSVCGNVRREPGLPWEPAAAGRSRCFPCTRAEIKRERATRETKRP